MSEYTITVTMSFGMESVVAWELSRLTGAVQEKRNGAISFRGSIDDMIACNLWLRSADRVHLELSSFRAGNFDDLYEGAGSVPWGEIVPSTGKIDVSARSSNPGLVSIPACQSMVKKRIIEELTEFHKIKTFPETGPRFHVDVVGEGDHARILLDTSGPGLHRRGYRSEGGKAPLKETLAAGIIDLARWSPERVLADPMCGSGTFAIEAALRGRNIAPGLSRKFDAESWLFISPERWEEARNKARAAGTVIPLDISASDSDPLMIIQAKRNAERAGVLDAIRFSEGTVGRFSSSASRGVLIVNPPYGERLLDDHALDPLYGEMRRAFSSLDGWSCFILTADENFQKRYGKRANKNRKLFNGGIKTWLYSYFGELPGRS